MHAMCDGLDVQVIMPRAFTFADLRCFADPSDARSYYFLPTSPRLQRDPKGVPILSLLDVGSSGYLMFTATWTAADSSVETLRQYIAHGSRQPDASGIRLAFAPLSSVECHALLGDGRGSFQTIATSTTSGMPPYDAVFALTVAGERLAAARAAMRGEHGFLAIEYTAALLVPSTSSAIFRSADQALLPWLRERRASGVAMRAQLEEAVEAGLATVTVEAVGQPGDEVVTELFDRVLSQAAQMAPRWIAESGYGDIVVHVAVDRDVREPVRVLADVGGILAGGSATPSQEVRDASDR